MVDYENVVKDLRLNWLKNIVDDSYNSFWKLYLRIVFTSL